MSNTPSTSAPPELPLELWLSIASYLPIYPSPPDPDPNPNPFIVPDSIKFGDVVCLASTCRLLNNALMPGIFKMSAADNRGELHLLNAAGSGCLSSVEKLLELGASLRFSNFPSHYPTALYNAAEGGHTHVVKYLIPLYGVHLPHAAHHRYTMPFSPPKEAEHGKTPLDAAAEMGNLEMVQLLCDIPFPNNVILIPPQNPTYTDHFPPAYAISLGLVPETMEFYMGWALRNAASNGHVDVVKYILAQGGDIDCRSHTRSTCALEAAVVSGHTEVVRTLLSAGAQHKVDRFGKTALHTACKAHNHEIIQLLIDNGADIFVESASGKNVISYSIPDIPLMRYFLERGVDVNHSDRRRMTPLHYAACLDDSTQAIECTKLFLEFGANTHSHRSSHRLNGCIYPIEQAQYHEHEELVELLLPYVEGDPEVMAVIGRGECAPGLLDLSDSDPGSDSESENDSEVLDLSQFE